MSDADNLTLGRALRTLPLATPTDNGWAALCEELQLSRQAPAHWRRYALPAALAATLAGAFVLSRAPQTSVPATLAPVAASSSSNGAAKEQIHNAQNAENPGARLAQLQQRSQALERWLRQTGDDAAPLQGQDLAAAAEIENLIGLVDVELAAPRQTQAQALWQRRVGLLEDLAALRYSNYRLAAGHATTMAYQID
ncbi:MAG: hypothetical protein KGI64_11425 [Xanthomonadaceae bacterium]|nr:hypothetical protein [Xanthomonadaceae bacterium]MDE2085459.1 hypothetical protein [Xanthomonadaceae bacterium]